MVRGPMGPLSDFLSAMRTHHRTAPRLSLLCPLAAAVVASFFTEGAHARGSVETARFESAALGVEKSFRIYLPEGYAASRSNYPVIYLLHGWGATERTWTDDAALGATADAAKLQAIIVM